MTPRTVWPMVLGIVACQSVLLAEEPVKRDLVAKLHALIKPKPSEERWTDIPWMASLWEARKRAAAEGRPILLWEMDGHPLGCS